MARSLAMTLSGSMLLAAFVAGAAGTAGIDAGKSTIIATFRQENVPVDADFKRFSGHIDYDPALPNASKAAIEVTTGSLDLGSEDYNSEVRKKSWLDSGTYPPPPSFRPRSNGGGRAFRCHRRADPQGKTQTLTVPVSVGKVGAATSFDGN